MAAEVFALAFDKSLGEALILFADMRTWPASIILKILLFRGKKILVPPETRRDIGMTVKSLIFTT